MKSEEWNKKFEIGMNVIYTDDIGNKIETQTRSEAWDLCHGESVVKLEGMAGGMLLRRVQPGGSGFDRESYIEGRIDGALNRRKELLRKLADIDNEIVGLIVTENIVWESATVHEVAALNRSNGGRARVVYLQAVEDDIARSMCGIPE